MYSYSYGKLMLFYKNKYGNFYSLMQKISIDKLTFLRQKSITQELKI